VLSFDGWSAGIAYCLKIILDLIFTLFYIYKARNNNIKQLFYPAICMFSFLLAYIPYIMDFSNILLTNNNIQVTNLLHLWIITCLFVAALAVSILGINLTFKDKRKFFITTTSIYSLFLIISAIILLYFNIPNSGFSISYPNHPGVNLIKPYWAINSIFFYLIIPYFLFLFYLIFSFILKSFKLKGQIRKKFQLLAIFYIDGLIFFFLIVTIQKVGFLFTIFFLLTGFIIWVSAYYSLTPIKEKRQKKKKAPSDKELEFVSYLMKKPASNQAIEGESLVSSKLKKNILVFVSYSSKDRKIFKIQDIAEKLKAYQGIRDVLFYEGESIDNIIKYMNDNLGQCDAFLLFCSQNALSSVPVEKEWTAAEAMGVPIIPIFFDLKHVPPLLQSRLGVDYDFYNLDQTVKEIYSSIVKKCVERD